MRQRSTVRAWTVRRQAVLPGFLENGTVRKGKRMPEAVMDYVCVDLETTGLRPKLDKIIEIGAVRVISGEIAGTFETFVYPGRAIPEQVTALTGITGEQLADAPVISGVLPGFLEFAGQLPLLGHRVLFDYSFLKRAFVNEKLSFERNGIDTLKLARKFLPQLPSKRLADLCAYYEIAVRPHRAMEDARASHFLYQRLCREFFCGNEKDFAACPLLYKAKREGPATKAQKQRLIRLCEQYGRNLECDPEMLTKNEASRLIDNILAAFGSLQNRGK